MYQRSIPRPFISTASSSWIRFNHHVLEEARDERHPLLERVKFLSIFANNLDEFFMIRVSGLQRQAAKGVLKAPPDGMTASEQILAIEKALIPELDLSFECWNSEILPRLAAAGIFIHEYGELDEGQKQALHTFFVEEVFPVLTPLAFDSAHPFPFISNLSLNLAITIRDPNGKESLPGSRCLPASFPGLSGSLIPRLPAGAMTSRSTSSISKTSLPHTSTCSSPASK